MEACVSNPMVSCAFPNYNGMKVVKFPLASLEAPSAVGKLKDWISFYSPATRGKGCTHLKGKRRESSHPRAVMAVPPLCNNSACTLLSQHLVVRSEFLPAFLAFLPLLSVCCHCLFMLTDHSLTVAVPTAMQLGLPKDTARLCSLAHLLWVEATLLFPFPGKGEWITPSGFIVVGWFFCFVN